MDTIVASGTTNGVEYRIFRNEKNQLVARVFENEKWRELGPCFENLGSALEYVFIMTRKDSEQ